VRSGTWFTLAWRPAGGYDRRMLWRIALVWLALAVASRGASANGRPPGTSSISFRQGHETDIAVGLTFGLMMSHDAGKTWQWMCEDAIGYKGMYDPHYAYSPSGALFASTFTGLKVVRNSCTFDKTPAGDAFLSSIAQGPDAFYYAAAQEADAPNGILADHKIYRSADDGMTFPQSIAPVDPVSWWQTMRIAPSNPSRVYLSGYTFLPDPSGTGTIKNHLLFRSDDAGKTWTPLPIDTAKVMLSSDSAIDIVGIDSDNADRVYLRVEAEANTPGESIYRSDDKGATWTKLHHSDVPFGGVVVRAARNAGGKHDLVAATQLNGSEVSHDDGVTWLPLAGAPHINCLVENAAGELWACTLNYKFNNGPTDSAGLMKTTDLVTWTKVMRYEEMTDAVTCAAGTPQQDLCVPMWCAVCQQLGCHPSPQYGCPGQTEAPAPPSKAGCCDTGASGAGPLALGLMIGTVVLRPRRRRAS
jgi:hypothetical protein